MIRDFFHTIFHALAAAFLVFVHFALIVLMMSITMEVWVWLFG